MPYEPLYSVQPFDANPPTVLEDIIKFYCPLDQPLILDATINFGRIWGKKGKNETCYPYGVRSKEIVEGTPSVKFGTIGLDIWPGCNPHVVADNTNTPFKDSIFDVVVYDPPHTGDQGKSTVGFSEKFGVGVTSKNPEGKWGNLFHTYPPFVQEANRIIKPGGLLLVKLADCTHAATFQFATAEFWLAARAEFELQGVTILPRKSTILDPKWKKAYHPRQNHSTWMAFTKRVPKKNGKSNK